MGDSTEAMIFSLHAFAVSYAELAPRSQFSGPSDSGRWGPTGRPVSTWFLETACATKYIYLTSQINLYIKSCCVKIVS
jgi:hypothetical protein